MYMPKPVPAMPRDRKVRITVLTRIRLGDCAASWSCNEEKGVDVVEAGFVLAQRTRAAEARRAHSTALGAEHRAVAVLASAMVVGVS